MLTPLTRNRSQQQRPDPRYTIIDERGCKMEDTINRINCKKQEAVVRKESLARAQILSQLPTKNKLLVSLDEPLETICNLVLKK